MSKRSLNLNVHNLVQLKQKILQQIQQILQQFLQQIQQILQQNLLKQNLQHSLKPHQQMCTDVLRLGLRLRLRLRLWRRHQVHVVRQVSFTPEEWTRSRRGRSQLTISSNVTP